MNDVETRRSCLISLRGIVQDQKSLIECVRSIVTWWLRSACGTTSERPRAVSHTTGMAGRCASWIFVQCVFTITSSPSWDISGTDHCCRSADSASAKGAENCSALLLQESSMLCLLLPPLLGCSHLLLPPSALVPPSLPLICSSPLLPPSRIKVLLYKNWNN